MQFYIKDSYSRWQLNESGYTNLVAQIAQIMGWEFIEKGLNGWAKIANGNKSLSFRMETHPNNTEATNPRIKISVNWRYERDGVSYSLWEHISKKVLESHTTEITCAVSRGADTIAKDIQKRLLPDYFKLWDIGLIEYQKDSDWKRLRKERADHLFGIVGSRPHPNYSDGYTMDSNPKIKPDLIQELGLNKIKDISVRAEVYIPYSIKTEDDPYAFNRDGKDGDVRFKLTVPWELSCELMEWVASKTINCFETWKEKNIKSFIRWLDMDAEEAGLPEVTELPPNTFNWEDAYNKYCRNAEGYFSEASVFNRFKESIIMENQISARADPSVSSEPQQEEKPMEVTLESVLELASQLSFAEQAELVSILMGNIAENLEDEEVEIEDEE